MSKAIVSYGFWIHRKNIKTGFYETIWFQGNSRQIPKGWHLGKAPIYNDSLIRVIH